MRYSHLLLIVLLACNATKEQQVDQKLMDIDSLYQEYGVEGSFILYDPQQNIQFVYNPKQLDQPFTPASTFKICNAMIGLETGVISDKNYVIPWDSVTRNPYWDKDHDLASAYKFSVVWYFQELARNVGQERMADWVQKADYGNTDISGGIDQFWLSGGLRITPSQQIDFLENIHNNELPFSDGTVKTLKEIMVEADTAGFVLRTKTGWGGQDGKDIGWYVGYVTHENKVYYFANCIQVASSYIEKTKNAIAFDKSRREIAYKVLQDKTGLPLLIEQP